MSETSSKNTGDDTEEDSVLGMARRARARATAKDAEPFVFTEWRSRTADAFKRRVGYPPYGWQLNAVEGLQYGLDTMVLAGTGSGKTWLFAILAIAGSKKSVIVLSPLNELERQHALKFSEVAGLSAIAINSTTYTDAVHKVRLTRLS